MKKKTIIIVMCIAILFMAVGYAVFSANLKINGTANIASTWNVEFTKIEEISKTSGVTIKTPPTASETTATFDVDVHAPGDEIVYRITVENKGTIDAIISDIKASKTGNDAIKFEITGIKKGDRLAKKTTTTFSVSIAFDSSVTEQPGILNDDLTIDISYVQDAGQTIPSEDVVVEGPPTLAKQILKDNVAQPDTNIDFSQISSDTNGKGLYYTSTNTEDNKVTYYFRGNVTNNYVSFANNIWRIVRINEDGSIRLILEDSIGSTNFNATGNDATYVGYMYGIPGSSIYKSVYTNASSSTIKQLTDTWYQNNLINYSSFLADAGFCGDRSLSSGPGYGTVDSQYNGYKRYTDTPQFKCPQTNDLYTTATSTKGNKALTYPIGLITADEVVYAGMIQSLLNANASYMYNGLGFWTMTPSYTFYLYDADGMGNSLLYLYLFAIDYEYILNPTNIFESYAARPVINLKSTTMVSNGTGTSSNPYVIKIS